MNTIRNFLLALSAMLMLWAPLGHAEDIDLFSDNSGATGEPNVLFILDNGANFSASAGNCTYVDAAPGDPPPTLNGTAGGIEQCALYNVIKSLPADVKVKMGLMVFNDNNMRDIDGFNCGGSNGGCLSQKLAPMGDATARAKFLAWIKKWIGPNGGTVDIKASGDATSASMQEAWAYYAGKTGLSGRNYSSIQPPAGCQKNFVIYVGNAFTTSGTGGDTGNASPKNALLGLLSSGSGMNASPPASTEQKVSITIPSGSYGTSAFSCGPYVMANHEIGSAESKALYADEWARYMRQTDIFGGVDANQGITTYTVGLLGPACKPDYPALLSSMASKKAGAGAYFATSNYEELIVAIQKILNEIQAVNSVFASASLPVSVSAEGTFLNQIFLGVFRPDPNANPRWLGNLKQYQFILIGPDPKTATLQLGDRDGNEAVTSGGTGFISPNAVSFWTSKNESVNPDLTGGFFFNDSRGTGTMFDEVDGDIVEKGGVAQQLRLKHLEASYVSPSDSLRKLYTYCPSGACNPDLTQPVNAFATSNPLITDALLGATSGIPATIARVGTTATVTAASHGFSNGGSVNITGAVQGEYNGQKDLITGVTANTFNFTMAEYPPTPASGSPVLTGFTASLPGSPQDITDGSLTRIGTTATVVLAAHGFVTGQTVVITGASTGYNGAKVITKINDSTFTYPVVEGPVSPAGSGTAKVGATTRNIEAFNSNPNPGVVRAPGSLTATVTTTANHGFSSGNSVTIAGVVDSANSAIAEYNIGPVALIKLTNKSFTYLILSTTPANPAVRANLLVPIKADGSAAPKAITNLTRSGTVATATSAAHVFGDGQTVSVGGTPGTNEGNYAGSYVISGVTANTFQYNVVTAPTTPTTGSIFVRGAGTSGREELISWVRGHDNRADEASPGFGYTVRPSIHGDVLHSRPAVINYGDDRGLVVFYGANDGVFRAINGSQDTTHNLVPPGGELWGLVLREHYDKLNRQRVNTPELKLPSTTLLSAKTKDYFVDGSPGVLQKLNANGTINTAILYLTMRRGGRVIYALDVSDPTTPIVKWTKDSTSTGFSQLGQTWSRPRVTLVRGYTDTFGVAKPVVIFGGGYDPKEDTEPPTLNTMGTGIYVVDAYDGTLVWSATQGIVAGCTGSGCTVPEMTYSIPSEMTFRDRDSDGFIDRIYAGDMGGNVWRVDLVTTDPATSVSGNTPDNWRVTKLAALGCATGACGIGSTPAPRKFFFPPTVVSVGATGAASSYEAVLTGSGDREHPLINTANLQSSYKVSNRFYMIKDTVTTASPLRSLTNLAGVSGVTTRTETDLFKAFKASTISSFQQVDAGAMTITTAAAHGFAAGAVVVIDGANPSSLDGQYTINSKTDTTFTFTSTGVAGASAAATGAATVVVPFTSSNIEPGFYTYLAVGEKVVNAPITISGVTFFGTNRPVPPSVNSCTSNLGEARGYALDPFAGTATSTVYGDGIGLPPSPVAGVVSITTGNTSVLKRFCIGCGGSAEGGGKVDSPIEVTDPFKKVPKKTQRTYWYRR